MDDLYFEDFCRKIVNIRKKKIYKEVKERTKVVEKLEEEKKKQIVISKGPLRRFNSELLMLGDVKRRAHSILPKKPAYENMMKSGNTNGDNVVELKPMVKLYHPMINPVTLGSQVGINGERKSPKRGQSIPYVEKRYRLMSNTGAASFMKNSPEPKIINKIVEEESQSQSEFMESRNLDLSNKILINSKDPSKLTDSWKTDNSQILEGVKANIKKMRTAKSVESNRKKEKQNSESEGDIQLDNKFENTQQEKVEKKSDSSENESDKIVKGGIEKGKDGYYYGNILSYPIQDFQTQELKQKLIKTRLMPVKNPSEGSNQSITSGGENSDLKEVDEDNYEINKKQKPEKTEKREEEITSIHLVASFNYWFPIKLPSQPRSEDSEEVIYKF